MKLTAKSGERTLLASVLLSSPGPLVLGAALFFGRSSTQLADFVRRTAELGAIIISWLVYRAVQNTAELDLERSERLERLAGLSVGIAMCLSGLGMILAAYLGAGAPQGNVIPGLVIAVLGVVTNTWFWLRYRRINLAEPNAIIAVQSKLYRAKSLVDGCVVIALLAVALAPGAFITPFIDLAGSTIVSAYLVVNGMKTLQGSSVKGLS